jgi:uncharacterized phage protein (TIGR01671 family)
MVGAMREIKFRGKSLESGLWVYGYVIFSKPFADGKRWAWIIEESILPLGAVSTPTSKFIQVDPETVGQFTGLQDKNGRDIYEGDILREHSGDEYCNGGWSKTYWIGFIDLLSPFDGYVRYDDFEKTHYMVNGINPDKTEIIGNIHDNPELLK